MPNNSHWTLTGKTALVTGASKGIGLAVSKEMLELGAEVIACARGMETLEKEFAAYTGKNGKVHLVAADVTKTDGRKKVFDTVASIGKLDILVNNVGTNIRKKAEDYSEDEISFLLNTNITSALEVCRGVHGWLKKGKDPNVIFVSSIAGLGSVGSGVIYGSTKAALAQMSRSFAHEWAVDGIRVNAIAPGFIETPLIEGLLSKDLVRSGLEERPLLKRVGRPRKWRPQLPSWRCPLPRTSPERRSWSTEDSRLTHST